MVQEKGPDRVITNENDNNVDLNDEGLTEEEFHTLNDRLDEINGWLDDLEQKNDDIRAQLVDLSQQCKDTVVKLAEKTEPVQEPMETDKKKESQ